MRQSEVQISNNKKSLSQLLKVTLYQTLGADWEITKSDFRITTIRKKMGGFLKSCLIPIKYNQILQKFDNS